MCVCVRVWLCMRMVRVRCDGGIWLVRGGVAGCVACLGAARGGAVGADAERCAIVSITVPFAGDWRLVISITITGPYLVSA